ncbi:AI-2E family transporter [Roseomonas sp. NAR14]|uniref:AI-2E family transporter n=1 Tax=Roseomonas acroporae TaxID=2937791 RepID=A0A9X1Y2Z3_9PROT|nr:AI-2E family transporter [Roseomonas acroporae]MCK8782979.1 AI-2E family transporter [Roseomonas acroporae]
MSPLPPGREPRRDAAPAPSPPAAARPAGAAPAGRAAPAQPGSTRGQRLALMLGLLLALLFLIWLFSAILTPFVLAASIAYFLDPPTTRLTRLGMPRTLAAALLITGLGVVFLLCVLLLYPLLVQQVAILLQRLPAYVLGIGRSVREALGPLEARLGPEVVSDRLRELAVGQAGSILYFVGTALARVITGSVALFNVFTLVVVTPIVAFYLLRDWPRMIARAESWLPRRSAATLRQLGRDTDRVLSAWLRGQLICCAGLAVYYAVALSAAGLELGLTVGLLSGFLTFIPYVGSFTGLLLSTLLAMAQFDTWSQVGLVVGIFVAGQILEGYVIYPRLLGDRVELHAVWVIFALFAGGVAFGFLGVLLAVPMAAALGVVARYWLRRYLESPLYLDPPRAGR